MLDRQNLPISFAGGVDQKTDPKQVIPAKLLKLQNGYLQNPKEIRKRNGYTALSQDTFAGGSVSNGVGISSFKNGLTILDGKQLYGYSSANSKWKAAAGGITPVGVNSTSIYASSYNQSQQDSAYDSVSGLQAFIWLDSSSSAFLYSIIDTKTGDRIVNGVQVLGAGTYAKVMAFSGYFVFFVSSSGNNFVYLRIPTSAPTTAPSAPITIDATAGNQIFDVAISGANLYATVQDSGGSIKSYFLNSSFTLSSPATIAAESASLLTIWGDASGNLWIAWRSVSAESLKYYIYAPSLASTVLSTTVIVTFVDITVVKNITGCAITGSSSSKFVYETSTGGINNMVNPGSLTNAGSYSADAVTPRYVGLGGKVFYNSGTGRSYAMLLHFISSLEPTYFLYDLDSKFVVAKIAQGTAPQSYLRYNNLPEVNLISSGVYFFSILEADQFYIGRNNTVINTGITGIQITYGITPQQVEIANGLHISGGLLSLFDGALVAEHGFNLFPEHVTVSTSTMGGSIADGTYQYIAVFSWIDAQGQLHLSAPSIAVQITTAGGGTSTNTVTIPTLSLTQKTGIVIQIYRTDTNGTIFYRIDKGEVLNDPSLDTVSFTDTYAAITSSTQLYTTGGVVENIAPPSILAICTYKNRLIVIPADNRFSWWYSKEIIPGLPAEFSDLFVENLDQIDGVITNCRQMDDKLILTKTNSYQVVTGDGPANTGANNDFSSGQLISSESGCINLASLASTDKGLFMQAIKGIVLLDRSLGTQYVGADVENLLNGNLITSAEVMSFYNQVRFTLNNNICLVYDYYMNQWYTFLNHNAVSSTIFQGNFTYIHPNGQVWEETPGTYTDNGAFIPLLIQTSWLSLAQLQGFQRIYKLMIFGEYKGTHQLQVQVSYDFDPAVLQTDLVNTINQALYQYRVFMARQKCEAIQFVIQDVQSSSFNEGLRLSSMAFEVGVKRGLNKLPPTQSYG